MNNPTTKLKEREKHTGINLDRVDAARTNQQSYGKRWWTSVIRTKQNKPETTWETLVDVCKENR